MTTVQDKQSASYFSRGARNSLPEFFVLGMKTHLPLCLGILASISAAAALTSES